MQFMIQHVETWLHRVNPALKLILFTLFFVAVIFIHNPNVLLYVTCGTMLMLFWSGHPWKRVLLYASPFILVFISTSTGMMFFGEGKITWLKYGLIHITQESFYRGLHLGLRALSLAAIGLLFGLTTRPVNLFYSLMQQLKLPPKYAYSFLAAMRMVPILIEEFQTLRHALKIRGTKRQGRFPNIYKTIKRYSIPLLAQSIRRAQRIAVAMEAKGFTNDSKRTYYYRIGYSLVDIWFSVYFVILFVLAYELGAWFPFVGITDVR
ncbi:energy-coupling factor transporter transmembrane component T [Paenibacillus sediminis]|uniref:Energy-coupling factor transport system permease protein n=1 Tax=Paenibacillus sediminis TaxID=664909 RepID=A0ABS4H405_9BACL|nr:energy-coupling factor transporter transmembrane component T [Paenibacillus sediminis]MBP1936997.1 energy-coupling factor transport system permease protein [Paenibacillus sediminis]